MQKGSVNWGPETETKHVLDLVRDYYFTVWRREPAAEKRTVGVVVVVDTVEGPRVEQTVGLVERPWDVTLPPPPPRPEGPSLSDPSKLRVSVPPTSFPTYVTLLPLLSFPSPPPPPPPPSPQTNFQSPLDLTTFRTSRLNTPTTKLDFVTKV